MNAIVTVLGQDRVGIIAAVCALLAENNVNILDISQTILQGAFTMVMAVDLAGSAVPFGELARKLEDLGVSSGRGSLRPCTRSENTARSFPQTPKRVDFPGERNNVGPISQGNGTVRAQLPKGTEPSAQFPKGTGQRVIDHESCFSISVQRSLEDIC